MMHQVKAPQFYADLGLQKQLNPPVNSKIQGLFKVLECFQVLLKANLIFKDFSRHSCIFKYFSSLCEPCFNGGSRKSSIETKLFYFHGEKINTSK